MDSLYPVCDIHLPPGEVYFGGRNNRICTLLGSCVAIAVWHPRLRIGGMCHYILPQRHRHQENTMDGRYADEAVHLLLREITAAGTRPEEYRVRLFGGGNMLNSPSMPRSAYDSNIPQKNIAAGRRFLEQHGFQIEAEDLGGFFYRHVLFNLGSGETVVRRNQAGALPLAPLADRNPP